MNNRTDEIIKQLNRLVNNRSLASFVRNKLRDAINHVRELQFKLSAIAGDEAEVKLEPAQDLEALTSRQRDLIKKLEYENRHLRLKIQALTKRVRDLKQAAVAVDKEPA